MRKPAANIVRIGCLVLWLNGFADQSATGYTLVDWIRTWPASAPGAVAAPAFPTAVPTYPAPAPAYAAPAPSCGAAAPSCEARPPSYYSAPATTSPAPNCGAALPSTPSGAGVSYLQPTVNAGTPIQQVRYRSTWVRVPTTNYRPIVNYDPATGWPTTTMLPCTTYTWQLRRVPAAGPGSRFLDALRNLFGPAYPAPAPAVGTFVPAPVATPGWTGSAAPASPATLAYPTPTYPTPGYAAPATASPSVPDGTTTPLAPPSPSPGWSPSGSLAPSTTAPSAPHALPGSDVPAGSAPADQPPSLSPQDAQGLQPLPEVRRYPPANQADATSAPAPLLTPSVPSSPPSPPNVSPVPDPDAGSGRTQVPAAPSLYDPNGRTARVLPLSTRWPAAPIRWPEHSPKATQPTVTASAADEQFQTPAPVDTGGWQAVRP